MTTIDGSMITWRGGRGNVDASTLGWQTGHWPEQFVVRSRTGSTLKFIKSHGDPNVSMGYSSMTWKDLMCDIEILDVEVWNS